MLEQIKTLLKTNQLDSQFQKGKKGNQIKTLQKALNEMGYGTEIQWKDFGADGDYGNATTKAVKAFADRIGVPSDGTSVNAEIAEQILFLHPAVPDLQRIKRKADDNNWKGLAVKSSEKGLVKSLQRLLNLLGNDLGVDGDYGPATTGAVKAFADDIGIGGDGTLFSLGLAHDLIDRFSEGLGDAWMEVSSSSHASGSGQYFKLHPMAGTGDKRRDVEGVKATRGKMSAETYIFPEPKNLPRYAQEVGGPQRPRESRKYKYNFEFLKYPIKGETHKVHYYGVTKVNEAGQIIDSFHFKSKPPKKDQIILHFTVGFAEADLKTLTQEDYEVSTAYVLGRDGAIYRLFSPEQWSFHLGKIRMGSQTEFCKRSIGIEVSNFGRLKEENGVLKSGSNVYCSLDDTEAYIKLKTPYREYQYYATYTEEQYESLILLLRFLVKEYDIKPNFLPTDAAKEAAGDWDAIPRYAWFRERSKAEAFEGICSHVNYRKSGKWDMSPAFDWEKVIAGVQADSFKPTLIDTRSFDSDAKQKSEAELIEERADAISGRQDPDAYGPDGPEVDI